MHYAQRTQFVLARLPGISATSNENYRRYNFQTFANISENFRKIYNLTGRPLAVASL